MKIDLDDGSMLARSQIDAGRQARIDLREADLFRIAENHFKLLRRSDVQSPGTIVMVAEYLDLLAQEFTQGDHRLIAHGLAMNLNEKAFEGTSITLDILINDVIRPALLKEVESNDLKSKLSLRGRTPSVFSIMTDGGNEQGKNVFSIPVILLHAYMRNREQKSLPVPNIVLSLVANNGDSGDPTS